MENIKIKNILFDILYNKQQKLIDKDENNFNQNYLFSCLQHSFSYHCLQQKQLTPKACVISVKGS